MKKIVVALSLTLSALVGMAQNKAIMLKDAGTLDKAKTEIDQNVTDAKLSGKAKTWYTKGQIYQAIANDGGAYAKLDSNAAIIAYESYKKALEVEPNGGKLNKEITDALKSDQLYRALMVQGNVKYQAKNFAGAVGPWVIAGEIMPKDTTSALYTGIAAQQAKNMDVAKAQFERYASIGGKDPSVYYSLASLYRNDKEIDKALAALDKGLAVLPGNKDLSAEKVNIYMTSGRGEDAIKSMKDLIEKDPKNAGNLLNLGILYDNSASKLSDEVRKASVEAKKGGSVKKKLAVEKDALDAITGEITRLTGAIKAAKVPAKKADLNRQLAENQQRKTERQKAIADLEAQAKEAESGNSADAQKRLADLTQELNEKRSLAKEYYGKALVIEPANYDANFNLGVFYYNDAVEMKREVDAMEDMADYAKRGKEIEGRVCGKFKQAQEYFNKAKAVKDTDEELKTNLTSVETILKQFEGNKVTCVPSTN